MQRIIFRLTVLVALIISTNALAQSTSSLDKMTIYKTPWCGCCHTWSQAMVDAGYEVEIHDMDDLTEIKKQHGVTPDLQACHTAKLGSYVIEGHVPLEAIEKLLQTKPDIAGISVPGMPMGSLGMGYDPAAKYDVIAINNNSKDHSEIFYKAGE